MPKPCVLTIAGSDSGGGAGIQADLKTIAAFGVHGASAIAAITAQNSRAVTNVLALPNPIVEAQIDAVMSDLRPGVVKLGMLGTAELVQLVTRKLQQWKPQAIVLDPVIIAASGARLLEERAVAAVRDLLVPIATIVTPNWMEAGALISASPRGLEDIPRIALSFKKIGAKAVLIKGGHVLTDPVVDTLFDGESYQEFTHPRIPDAESHGTGCTLASAIAAGLALGHSLSDSCRNAVQFVHEALQARYAVGNSRTVYLGVFGSET